MNEIDPFMLQSCKDLFTIGTRVRLYSNGPEMVVSQWREDGIVCTEWFDGAKLNRDCFDPRCIKLA